MSWEYRVMRRFYPGLEDEDQYSYTIHEYYDMHGWTKDAMEPQGNTLAELKADYGFMGKAFDKPVLDYETGEEVANEDAE